MKMPPDNPPCTLTFDKDALTVSTSNRDEPIFRVKWSEVNTVVAFKRDCFTVDQICLSFLTADETLEITEDMHGWQPLIDALPSLLTGFPPWSEWWARVAQPPFATNVTRLFSR